jgi:ParB/RepB/Spo0J family partition protein
MSAFSKGFDDLANLLGSVRTQENKADETKAGEGAGSVPDKKGAASASVSIPVSVSASNPVRESELSELSGLSILAQATAETNTDFKIRKIALKDIEVKPQVRTEFDFGELLALSHSIEETGLKEPLTVAEKGANGKYRLINGERRYRAFGLIENVTPETRVDCIIDKRGYESETHLYETQIIDNVQRQDLSLLELAKGLKHLQSLDPKKYTQVALANLCGKKESQISDLFLILDANEDTAKLFDLTKDAQAIAKVIRIQDEFPEEVKDFCDKAELEGGTSRGKVEAFVKPLTEDPDKQEYIPDVATADEIKAAKEERDEKEEAKKGRKDKKKKCRVKVFLDFDPQTGLLHLLLADKNETEVYVSPEELIAEVEPF